MHWLLLAVEQNTTHIHSIWSHAHRAALSAVWLHEADHSFPYLQGTFHESPKLISVTWELISITDPTPAMIWISLNHIAESCPDEPCPAASDSCLNKYLRDSPEGENSSPIPSRPYLHINQKLYTSHSKIVGYLFLYFSFETKLSLIPAY